MKASYLVLVIMAVGVLQIECDNEPNSKAPDTNPTNGTVEPPVTTAAPVVPTNLVCNSCSCKDSNVDCKDRGLRAFFSYADWAGVVNQTPKVVDLSRNDFEKVTTLYELPIEVLNLSSCGILTIDRASFKNLQRMRVLDLSRNKLTAAQLNPHVFEGLYAAEEYEPLGSMKVLNLAENDLHSLHPDVFEHLPGLEELSLAGNPFTIIDHSTVIAISSLPYIKTLNLASCQLKDLPETFLHTPRHLEDLDLSDNHMQSVPQELQEAKVLKTLNLNGNPIRFIVEGDEQYTGFPLIPSLKELHLCYMPTLEEIRNFAMGGLSGLEVLRMTNNLALSFLEPMILARKDAQGEGWDYPVVKELYLHNNNLTTVDSRLLGRWDQITKVDIRYNPFLCDCSNQWMVDTLVPIILETSPNITKDIICHDPIEMKGKSMVHLEEVHRHMRCSDKYGHRPERDGALLIGTVIGILLAVPICLALLLMYKRGYFRICGLKGPAEFSRAFYKRAHTDDFAF